MRGVTNHWTGTLDWTTGLTYFGFLHILRLVLLIPANQERSENLQSVTKMMSMRSGSKQKLTSSDFTSIYYVLLQYIHLYYLSVCYREYASYS